MDNSQRSEWTDEELRALENPDQWDWDSAVVLPPAANPGARFAVRFARTELDCLAAAAERTGRSVIQFIHDSALEQARAALESAATNQTDGTGA